MTQPPDDRNYLGATSIDQLAALVFELSSQLHVERQRRIVLEQELTRAALLPPDAIDRALGDADVMEKGRMELDLALRRLLRIVCERGDPRSPMRHEA